jgi:hypothetical protein
MAIRTELLTLTEENFKVPSRHIYHITNSSRANLLYRTLAWSSCSGGLKRPILHVDTACGSWGWPAMAIETAIHDQRARLLALTAITSLEQSRCWVAGPVLCEVGGGGKIESDHDCRKRGLVPEQVPSQSSPPKKFAKPSNPSNLDPPPPFCLASS